jgi:hypothetical protein
MPSAARGVHRGLRRGRTRGIRDGRPSERPQVQGALSEKVAETNVAIARRLAERPVRLHRVTMLLAAVVAFGALCVTAGYSLAGPVKPFWATTAESLAPLQREVAVILAAPTGWMVFALVFALCRPQRTARESAGGRHRRRSSDAQHCRLVHCGRCLFANAACAVMLPKFTRRTDSLWSRPSGASIAVSGAAGLLIERVT